jgi:hypothetical protein
MWDAQEMELKDNCESNTMKIIPLLSGVHLMMGSSLNLTKQASKYFMQLDH